jgi:hypothetical protein
MPNGNGSFAEKVAFVTGAAAEDAQRIRIRMGDQTVTATLNSSEGHSGSHRDASFVHPHA